MALKGCRKQPKSKQKVANEPRDFQKHPLGNRSEKVKEKGSTAVCFVAPEMEYIEYIKYIKNIIMEINIKYINI